jgi:hypothetical protein
MSVLLLRRLGSDCCWAETAEGDGLWSLSSVVGSDIEQGETIVDANKWKGGRGLGASYRKTKA